MDIILIPMVSRYARVYIDETNGLKEQALHKT